MLDADPTARTVATTALRAHKCPDIIQTTDGARALEVVAARAIDLILMDVRMPEPAGLTFLRRLRQVPGARALPVIIATVSDSPEEACIARQLGAFAWLAKPLNAASLISCALAALGRGVLRPDEAPLLTVLADQYEARLSTALQDVAHNAMRVQTGHRPFSACADEMLRQLQMVRGMAGLLGYSLVEEICSLMHDLHRSCVLNPSVLEVYQIEVMKLVRIGASSMAMLAEKRLRGSAGPAGPLIMDQLRPPLQDLQDRFDEIVAAAEAKLKAENDAMAIRRAEVDTEAWRLKRTVTLDSKLPT